MGSDPPMTPEVRVRLASSAKWASVRSAYFEPVRKDPSDFVMAFRRGRQGNVQTLIGRDGTKLRYDTRRHMITRVIFDGEEEGE